MTDALVSRTAVRRQRVRELVCSYRALRDSDGHVVDVPKLALSTPQLAAATLGPLLAAEPVEVFAVACLSARNQLLTWHIVSRGTRTSAPIWSSPGRGTDPVKGSAAMTFPTAITPLDCPARLSAVKALRFASTPRGGANGLDRASDSREAGICVMALFDCPRPARGIASNRT